MVASIKTVLIAGAFGSGTSAVAGALHHMGISTVPPHVHTVDSRTPNSYESKEFRKIILSFANQKTLSVDTTNSDLFVQRLKKFMVDVEASHRSPKNDIHPTYIFLKHPMASICLKEISLALDPAIILVHRPLEKIEATHNRRGWDIQSGATGAQTIYAKAHSDLTTLGREYLNVSFDQFLEETEQEIFRILNFCQIEDRSISSRIQDALKFVRGKDQEQSRL